MRVLISSAVQGFWSRLAALNLGVSESAVSVDSSPFLCSKRHDVEIERFQETPVATFPQEECQCINLRSFIFAGV
jgi:hypothetical protein